MEHAAGCGGMWKLGAVLAPSLVILFVVPPAFGADRRDDAGNRGVMVAQPRVRGNLLAPVRRQLALAFQLALRDIQTNPACSALFAEFGADGLELLARVEFDAATLELTGGTCDRGGVAAFTNVKSRRIRLCPGFAVLSVPAATVILIHETLHTAGMSERPIDPNGLAPQEINRLVATSCFR